MKEIRDFGLELLSRSLDVTNKRVLAIEGKSRKGSSHVRDELLKDQIVLEEVLCEPSLNDWISDYTLRHPDQIASHPDDLSRHMVGLIHPESKAVKFSIQAVVSSGPPRRRRSRVQQGLSDFQDAPPLDPFGNRIGLFRHVLDTKKLQRVFVRLPLREVTPAGSERATQQNTKQRSPIHPPTLSTGRSL